MSEHIATLGQLLDGAGTQWRAFDIGRHITKLDKKKFLILIRLRGMHGWLFNFGIAKQVKNLMYGF